MNMFFFSRGKWAEGNLQKITLAPILMSPISLILNCNFHHLRLNMKHGLHYTAVNLAEWTDTEHMCSHQNLNF